MKFVALCRLIPICFLFLSTALGALAADITVDSNCSLADAIQAAESDSAVGGCPAGDGADTIHLTGDITLQSEFSQIESEITIEGNGFSISGENRRRILKLSRRSTVTLRNLTLKNGRSETGGAIFNSGLLRIENSTFQDNEAYRRDGGAISNFGQLTITDSVFADNRADRLGDTTSSGGAIYNDEFQGKASELRVINSTFRGNWAEFAGGAIANEAGAVTIIESRFNDNSADFGGAIDSEDELSVSGTVFSQNSAKWGGAIKKSGMLTVTASRFMDNVAKASGGAIHSHHETNVTDSFFAGNSADTSGGAVVNNNGVLSVSGSRFVGNSAMFGGAINSSNDVLSEKAQLTVADTMFSENSAKDSGGALFGDGLQSIVRSSFLTNRSDRFAGAMMSFASQLTLTDSSFVGNSAEYSVGGLYVSVDVSAYFAHLTIAFNTADEDGGLVVRHDEDAEQILELRNSLISANAGGDCSGQFTEQSNNLIADGSCDPAISGDPKLGTLVEPEDGSPAYLPLLPNSPAIDAADPEHCTATDQIGAARPHGDGCDIGAVEFRHE